MFPEDTWAVTNLDKVDVSATLHEWLGDELAAPGSNARIEGDETDASAIVPPVRYGNRTQILGKTFLISRTQDKVSKAGRASESARESMKQMRELKRKPYCALAA